MFVTVFFILTFYYIYIELYRPIKYGPKIKIYKTLGESIVTYGGMGVLLCTYIAGQD